MALEPPQPKTKSSTLRSGSRNSASTALNTNWISLSMKGINTPCTLRIWLGRRALDLVLASRRELMLPFFMPDPAFCWVHRCPFSFFVTPVLSSFFFLLSTCFILLSPPWFFMFCIDVASLRRGSELKP